MDGPKTEFFLLHGLPLGFTPKGYISVAKDLIKEDELMNIVLDAGAEDMKHEDEVYEIYTAIADLEKVKQALVDKGIKWVDAEMTMIPSSTVKVTGHEAKQVLALIETLEDHDDVQQVYANFDIPDEILNEVASEE